MYRIIKTDGTELCLTDSVNYIKLHENGCFVQCPVSEAIGVAYNSTPYNLYGHDSIEGADTVIVTIVDGGKAVGAAQDKAEQAQQNNANIEDAMCEMDAANQERIAAIEDALCDMDEILNGGATE